MKFWTDKQGNKLTFSEFIKRWKGGIDQVTPLEKTRSELVFSYMVIIGVLCGIVTSFMALETLWWLVVVLCGTLGLQFLSLTGIYQKYNALKKFDEMLKGGSEENEINEQKSTA